ncbi:MAG: metallophosphoesterase [Gracilibacteraceae bacterium]|nr:metallophosphoesterase [Gracilibacteraceae bacterium]
MKVAIMSDTHLRDGQRLPPPVWDVVDTADMVLHAGDLTSDLPFAGLKERFVAVRGNCDYGLALPEMLIYPCENLRIGLVHGHQFLTLNRLCAAFSEDVPLLVFGHTHQPLQTRVSDRLVFNPGSPTQRRGQPRCSMGLLQVHGSDYELEHIFF